MEYLVSIITPCYNAAAYLQQTIDSVLAQSYQNWELLVIDDCSTDGSGELVKKYSRKDGRIKYLKTDRPSGSPSLPRNIGIEHAGGEYIAFLDSDDIWLPMKLEEQINFIHEHHYCFVYSNYEKISFTGHRNNRVVKTKKYSSYWDTIKSCEIPCLTVLLKKEIISDIRFKDIPKEDYVFWLEILRRGVVAYNTNKIHALYRETPSSRSSNKLNMFKKQWEILRRVEKMDKLIAFYCSVFYAFKGLSKFIK